MADPVTMAAVSVGTSLVGGGISAYSRYQQGQSSSQMYNYRAGISDRNAKIAAQNAEYAMNQGQQEAAVRGMKTGQQIGAARAKFGASNIAVGVGSAADTESSIEKIGAIDTATILNNAARVAYGYKIGEQQEKEQASLYRSAGADAKKAGMIGALGSLVSTAGSVAGKWMQYKQTFGGGTSGGSDLDTDPTYSNYGFNVP